MKALRKLMTSALVLGCATVVVASPAIAWQPNKPIDFIIMAGKGGGADKMARLMQGIVEKESLAERPLVPVNKSGGSGAEARRHFPPLGPCRYRHHNIRAVA